MCTFSEGIRRWGQQEGEIRGEIKGIFKNTIQFLQVLINKGYSISSAMELLGLPRTEFEKFKSALEKYTT